MAKRIISSELNSPVPLEKQVDDLKVWVIGGFIVLIVAVSGMLIAVGAMAADYFAMKQATYEDLKNKVVEQNFLIQSQAIQFEQLNNRLKTRYGF